jgi:methionyl-tRNA formyltransferase
MRMDPGMDTGPIIYQATTPIQGHDTAATLSDRLSQLGADTLIEALPAYLDGEIYPQPQDNSLATKAPLLKKKDGELDFNRTAEQLERQVRAFNPWPGCFTKWNEAPLKVHSASTAPDEATSEPGKKTIYKSLPAIQTSRGLLVLHEVQPAGKKRMQGEIFLRGAKDWKDI